VPADGAQERLIHADKHRVKKVVGIVALGLLLVACSNDPATRRGALPEQTWADRLCLSVGEYVADLGELVTDGGAGFAATEATNADQARTVLRRARRWAPRVVESVDQLAVNLADTGAPVGEGADIHAAVTTTVGELQTSLHQGLVTLRDIDLASVTPDEITRLNEALAKFRISLDAQLPDTETCAGVAAQLQAAHV
jgi:hypothetical protein